MKRTALAILLLLAACGRGGDARFAQAPGETQAQHGRRLSLVLGCAGCHGRDMYGRPWEEDADFAISFSSNLTRALPAYSDAQLERAIRAGVRPDGSMLWGMPSEIFTYLDAADVAALIAYLRTIPPGGDVHPRPRFGPGARREVASGAYKPAPVLARDGRALWPATLDGRHALARYITRATCAECHGLELKGRESEPGHPTPDLVVAGGYTRDQFRHLLRTGEPVGGRQLVLMDEVARSRFSHFTDGEVDAIYDYLHARAEAAH